MSFTVAEELVGGYGHVIRAAHAGLTRFNQLGLSG